MKQASIIVPCFNEEPVIEKNLKKISDYFKKTDLSFEIIAVDDGSKDKTSALLRNFADENEELRIISNGANLGKGASVRRGFLAAQGEYVLMTDADLSTPIETYEVFAGEMKRDSSLRCVIGSRPLPQSNIEIPQYFIRRKLGESFNVFIKLLLPLPYKDTQCGFKLFKREKFLPIFRNLKTDGFAFDVEVLYRAKKAGLKVLEHPVVWRNDPRSSVRLMLDSYRMLRDVIKIRIGR